MTLKMERRFLVSRMIKILGCIFVIFSTTVFGYNHGEKLKKRMKELSEIRRCICEIENFILYTHTELPEVVYSVTRKSKEPISTLFMEISRMLMENTVDDVYEAFKRVFSNQKDSLSLKNEDIEIILDFSKSLGESDIEGQKAVFSLAIDNLDKHIKKAESIVEKNVKMYRYLGFSTGAVIALLLI